MKNLFSGYYRPSDDEFIQLWSQAIFIFDTNVLLDLYSYPEDVRKVYLSVLSKLEDRLWIPYQVGMEFHKNRFSRIKQENKRVHDLLDTINQTKEKISQEIKGIELEKRNIGISDIDDRLAAIQTAHDALTSAVKLACDKLPPISLDDPIGDKLCELFDGRVGQPPANQSELDSILQNAQERFDNKIPPGFFDQRKAEAISYDRGITYLDKFGDLILWRQILAHAQTTKIKAIVFITRDNKKDWWWEEGGKTLGPLPQLAQEIASIGVSQFWMYTPDKFLENAETFLKATEVTPETVQQVKDLSENTPESNIHDNVNPVIDGGETMLEAIARMSRIIQREEISKNSDFYNAAQSPWKGLFPKLPAVSVIQDAAINSSNTYNRGFIRIEVLRDTLIATGTGKLTPSMIGVPFVIARLEQMPNGYSEDLVRFSAGAGTNFDFHINIVSKDSHTPLPLGEYIFSYEVKSYGNQ